MKNLIFLILICFFFGCRNSEDIVHTDLAPHQLETKNVNYTKAELSKLQTAEGKTVRIFEEEKLSKFLEGGRTIVFNINKAEDGNWLAQTLKLETMHTKFEDTFELIHLFVDEEKTLNEMTNYIRENNLASPAFYLNNVTLMTEKSDWKGNIPAILIQNQVDGINLLFEQTLNEDELLTILQIVTL